MADGMQTLQDVPVDWEALEDAFENNAPEVHSYLQVKTGEVLRVVDGIADPEMHSRISLDSNYMRIDPVSSREQYRWMERFIPMVENDEVQSRLVTAIDGKGAFRRFKDVLMSFATERERWFAFRSERLRVFMEAWLSAHGLNPITRPPAEQVPSETEEAATAAPAMAAPPITQEQLGGRRPSKGPELLRKQLQEVTDSMSNRDLEKVLVFAEFIKARRAAREYSSLPARPPVRSEVNEGTEDDNEPPSQRRITDRR